MNPKSMRRQEKQVTLTQVYASKIQQLQEKVLKLEVTIELLKEENQTLRHEIDGQR